MDWGTTATCIESTILNTVQKIECLVLVKNYYLFYWGHFGQPASGGDANGGHGGNANGGNANGGAVVLT
jgi:hypothetical protein